MAPSPTAALRLPRTAGTGYGGAVGYGASLVRKPDCFRAARAGVSQADYGADFDSRWGKSYDRVSAKSFDNESYARANQADDEQWAEDYDRYDAHYAN